ncbi:MAG TPA: peptidylprolyl isomerase [Gammaproteobacteria bacterium]
MNHRFPRRLAGAILATALLPALPQAAEPGSVLATVNGKALEQQTLDQYVARRPDRPSTPEALLQELINLELLVQDAEAKKLDQSPEFAVDMEMSRRSLLAQLALQDQLKSNPVSEESIREIYDRQFGAGGEEELKARHILLASEEEAKAVIAQLDGGADFASVAKERSTGPSGPQGGDLGWFSPGQMVPEFAAAASALEAGKYSQAPVQTQFGWHVILLEERRRSEPPPYEQVKPQIAEMLESMAVRDYLEGLRGSAKIEVK